MKFTDWKDELEKFGYVVTEDTITTQRGDVLAGKDPYGGIFVSDSRIQDILSKEATKKVRARTDKGHFVKDDPNTPENEAWTTKVIKKATRKNKAE